VPELRALVYNCYDPGASVGLPGVLSLFDNSYQPAFKADVGWDFATGIGSVNATNLVLNPIWLKGWSPVPMTQAAP
jgi:hypothetical protein